MLIGVVLPSAMYSMTLRNPTPAELLVAICIALFSSVVFLWILDATSILQFRKEWVSKSIYGAAIVSVLGTSVAVYKDAFASRKYPFEGQWELQINGRPDLGPVSQSVLLMYSDHSGAYWGYSDYRPDRSSGIVWIHVVDFDPESKKVNLKLISKNGDEKQFFQSLKVERKGKLFSSASGDDQFRLARPN